MAENIFPLFMALFSINSHKPFVAIPGLPGPSLPFPIARKNRVKLPKVFNDIYVGEKDNGRRNKKQEL